MALHWDFSAVKDLEKLFEDCKGIEQLAWVSMAIGMDRITSKNWMEFYSRYRAMEEVYEPYFKERQERYIYSPHVIKRCIGFKTNASTKTRAQWSKWLFDKTMENIEREFYANEESIDLTTKL